MKHELDDYESDILNSFESNSLKKTLDKSKKLQAIDASREYMLKSNRINIRISKYDLDNIKRIAATEGIPYQTLITSVLHKYALGYLDRDLGE